MYCKNPKLMQKNPQWRTYEILNKHNTESKSVPVWLTSLVWLFTSKSKQNSKAYRVTAKKMFLNQLPEMATYRMREKFAKHILLRS